MSASFSAVVNCISAAGGSRLWGSVLEALMLQLLLGWKEELSCIIAFVFVFEKRLICMWVCENLGTNNGKKIKMMI